MYEKVGLIEGVGAGKKEKEKRKKYI